MTRRTAVYASRVEGDSRRSRLRSFAIGGLVGAAGVLAAARRSPLRSSRRPQNAPAGLAAFEDAQQDIARLEITVNDAMLVSMVHGAGELLDQPGRGPGR